jgi:uncharacterized protein YerC
MTTAILPPDKVRALLAKYAPPIRNTPPPASALKVRQPRFRNPDDPIHGKLKTAQIVEIRTRAASDEPYNKIAADFGIATVTVSRIACGRLHANQPGPITKRYLPCHRFGSRRFKREEVQKMRQQVADGATIASIANKHGCSTTTMSDLIRGKSYKDAGGPIRK